MKKIVGKLMVMFLFLTIGARSVFAGIPTIIIDGEVVAEKSESRIVTEIKKVQDMYVADRDAGNNWTYQSSGSSAKTFEEAFEKGWRRTQCADGANKILKGAGVLPMDTGHFFGGADGTIHWGGNSREVVESLADIYQFNDGTRVSELMDSGFLQPGDVVTYVGFNHTNIYAGDGYWFDTGHAHCTRGSGDGAPYWTFYSQKGRLGHKVGCVIRFRNQYDDIQPDIVIENISSPVDENDDLDGIFIWPDDEGYDAYDDEVSEETVEETESECAVEAKVDLGNVS